MNVSQKNYTIKRLTGLYNEANKKLDDKCRLALLNVFMSYRASYVKRFVEKVRDGKINLNALADSIEHYYASSLAYPDVPAEGRLEKYSNQLESASRFLKGSTNLIPNCSACVAAFVAGNTNAVNSYEKNCRAFMNKIKALYAAKSEALKQAFNRVCDTIMLGDNSADIIRGIGEFETNLANGTYTNVENLEPEQEEEE